MVAPWPVVVAAATPFGNAALAIVRLDGSPLDAVLDRVATPLRPGPWRAGRARRVSFSDAGGAYDDGVVVVRRSPHSYTGNDHAEIGLHGNPLLVVRLVDACLSAGARAAGPGELTRRAVVNGRVDLLAAEGVDQLVRATSMEGLRIARDGLSGALGAQVRSVREALLAAAAELEARLDWPDDDLALTGDDEVLAAIGSAGETCVRLAATFEAGHALVDGVRVAIVGPVNAGKSSLFNALLGRTRALVDPRPGTTRDVVEARCALGPLTVTLLDTAGERQATDPIEAAGLALARECVEEADLLLVVVRASPDAPSAVERDILARTADRRRIVVYNGIDRVPVAAPADGWCATSALTGEGIPQLIAAIAALAGGAAGEGLLVASARQRDRLLGVKEACAEARVAFAEAGVAAAADAIVRGIEEIDALTGADTREDILDAVFARFCIGK